MTDEKKSIFDLADKFGVDSPFGNDWVKEDFKEKPNKKISESNLNTKEHYFSYDGKYLGASDKNVDRIYVADKKNDDGTFKNAKDLKITLEQFKGFSSLVWNESSGDKTESFAIANAVMNYLSKGGSNQLNSLNAIILKANTYARGVEQSLVDRYSKEKKNGRHEFEAIINALMRSNYPELITDTAFIDYSKSATHWDGKDLVIAFAIRNKQIISISNSHRDYIWSEESKHLLKSYYRQFGKSTITYNGVTKTNNQVNPENWTYKDSNFQVEATRVKGETLFQRLLTGFGEGYKKNVPVVDYSKLNLFS